MILNINFWFKSLFFIVIFCFVVYCLLGGVLFIKIYFVVSGFMCFNKLGSFLMLLLFIVFVFL